MHTLNPDQQLALSYVPAERRDAVRALWMLDATLAAAARNGREPMLRRIKLAWWREALERLDHAPPPAEPLLQALATHVLPVGVTGVDLAALENGWDVVADETLSEYMHAHASARGGSLFALTARLLSGGMDSLPHQGEGWALVDLARAGHPVDLAAAACMLQPVTWPTPLRPIGMLAVLAREDALHGLGAPGSPRRMARMLRHRLTGR